MNKNTRDFLGWAVISCFVIFCIILFCAIAFHKPQQIQIIRETYVVNCQIPTPTPQPTITIEPKHLLDIDPVLSNPCGSIGSIPKANLTDLPGVWFCGDHINKFEIYSLDDYPTGAHPSGYECSILSCVCKKALEEAVVFTNQVPMCKNC
jgi:hypothetical protein